MATGREISNLENEPVIRSVVMTDAPDAFTVLPDEVALILLHLGGDLSTFFHEDQ
ncbi:MAG: hypothetical protein V4537_03315 [Pseudomonadota bacterium]